MDWNWFSESLRVSKRCFKLSWCYDSWIWCCKRLANILVGLCVVRWRGGSTIRNENNKWWKGSSGSSDNTPTHRQWRWCSGRFRWRVAALKMFRDVVFDVVWDVFFRFAFGFAFCDVLWDFFRNRICVFVAGGGGNARIITRLIGATCTNVEKTTL